jgi:hypothetical protein
MHCERLAHSLHRIAHSSGASTQTPLQDREEQQPLPGSSVIGDILLPSVRLARDELLQRPGPADIAVVILLHHLSDRCARTLFSVLPLQSLAHLAPSQCAGPTCQLPQSKLKWNLRVGIAARQIAHCFMSVLVDCHRRAYPANVLKTLRRSAVLWAVQGQGTRWKGAGPSDSVGQFLAIVAQEWRAHHC